MNDKNFQVLKILKTLPKITIKQALSTLYEFFIIFFLTYVYFFCMVYTRNQTNSGNGNGNEVEVKTLKQNPT